MDEHPAITAYLAQTDNPKGHELWAIIEEIHHDSTSTRPSPVHPNPYNPPTPRPEE